MLEVGSWKSKLQLEAVGVQTSKVMDALSAAAVSAWDRVFGFYVGILKKK